jgi:Domain of unknown function (DUF4258)
MSNFLSQIQQLVAADNFEITAHAFLELNEDGILVGEIVAGLNEAIVVEDYPDYHKGSSILLLQYDTEGKPIHALWGVPKGKVEPAFLITAYRPNPDKWNIGFLTRRSK